MTKPQRRLFRLEAAWAVRALSSAAACTQRSSRVSICAGDLERLLVVAADLQEAMPCAMLMI